MTFKLFLGIYKSLKKVFCTRSPVTPIGLALGEEADFEEF